MEDDLCVRFGFNDYQYYKYIRPDKRFGYRDQNERVTLTVDGTTQKGQVRYAWKLGKVKKS